MYYRIVHAMAQHEKTHRLEGMVQMDDAYLGGERGDGTTGRGTTVRRRSWPPSASTMPATRCM